MIIVHDEGVNHEQNHSWESDGWDSTYNLVQVIVLALKLCDLNPVDTSWFAFN